MLDKIVFRQSRFFSSACFYVPAGFGKVLILGATSKSCVFEKIYTLN